MRFTAMLTPELPATYTWDFYELGASPGRDVERTFEPGSGSWHQIVDIGRDGRRYENGYVLVCPVAGNTCNEYDGCCEGFTCTNNVCR